MTHQIGIFDLSGFDIKPMPIHHLRHDHAIARVDIGHSGGNGKNNERQQERTNLLIAQQDGTGENETGDQHHKLQPHSR